SAAADLDLEPFTQRVDDRDADTVKTARDLVRRVLELASRVQHGQHDFRGRLAALLVDVDGNAAPIVADGARTVRVQDDLDAVAVAGKRLVDRVVDGLVDQVMQPVRARIADVHRRPPPHGLETLEHLDVTRGIGLCAHAAPSTAGRSLPVTHPPLTSHRAAIRASATTASAVVRNTCPLHATCSSTRSWTAASSSDRASSSNKTGELPTASATGRASASRSANAIRRC